MAVRPPRSIADRKAAWQALVDCGVMDIMLTHIRNHFPGMSGLQAEACEAWVEATHEEGEGDERAPKGLQVILGYHDCKDETACRRKGVGPCRPMTFLQSTTSFGTSSIPPLDSAQLKVVTRLGSQWLREQRCSGRSACSGVLARA